MWAGYYGLVPQMRREESGKIMDRLLMLYVVAVLILFLGFGAANGEEFSSRVQSHFFSASPMFQADVMALEMRHGVNSPAEIDYKLGIIPGSSAIVEAAPGDRWNEIRLSGLTLSLSRHVEKEYTRRMINMTPESPYTMDAILPLLLRGARRTGDIEFLGGFLSPHFNLEIAF